MNTFKNKFRNRKLSSIKENMKDNQQYYELNAPKRAQNNSINNNQTAKSTTKKVVLAEDNSLLLLLLKFRLQKEGYEILTATNGKEALELIQEHKPELVLTDIMMPFVSGLEIISHVRNKLKLETPIIIFSAAGQEEIVIKAFDLGATDFMSKPISPNELIIRVKKLLH